MLLSYEYPYLILLIFPLLWCLYKCKEKLIPKYFVHLQLFRPSKKLFKLEWLLKVLTLLALIIAMASPILVDKEDPLNRKGIDIVLSLDGSGSMNASGFDENSLATRFEIVQELASDFIMRRTQDNIGVVLYGDFAFVASPVTYEKEIVAEMISYLNHGMAGQNTAIGEGIAMSVRALDNSKATSKVIILLSDGEHNSGRISPKNAVKYAKEADIKIYTIGIGKAGEYDQALLQEIADNSGGKYFAASNKEELSAIYENIDALETSEIKSRAFLLKEYFYYIPLFLVLALLFLQLNKRSGL